MILEQNRELSYIYLNLTVIHSTVNEISSLVNFLALFFYFCQSQQKTIIIHKNYNKFLKFGTFENLIKLRFLNDFITSVETSPEHPL